MAQAVPFLLHTGTQRKNVSMRRRVPGARVGADGSSLIDCAAPCKVCKINKTGLKYIQFYQKFHFTQIFISKKSEL